VVGGTAVQFRWDSAHKVYDRFIGGVQQHAANGNPIATPNVIVQFTSGYPNPGDVDRAGNEDVTNEDKSERRLSGGELFAEVLEMKSRRR